jgi:hypothetical protein
LVLPAELRGRYRIAAWLLLCPAGLRLLLRRLFRPGLCGFGLFAVADLRTALSRSALPLLRLVAPRRPGLAAKSAGDLRGPNERPPGNAGANPGRPECTPPAAWQRTGSPNGNPLLRAKITIAEYSGSPGRLLPTFKQKCGRDSLFLSERSFPLPRDPLRSWWQPNHFRGPQPFFRGPLSARPYVPAGSYLPLVRKHPKPNPVTWRRRPWRWRASQQRRAP